MKNHNDWLEKARRDYEIAYKLLDDIEYPYIPEALYHAQQSMEKTLKGFLVFHNITPNKTHNLTILLNACISIDSSLQVLKEQARELTIFAIKTRYPEDDFIAPYLPTAKKYVDDAKFAFDTIHKLIS